jgi:ABC-type multidrug transport system fused ATPase/permease subunit
MLPTKEILNRHSGELVSHFLNDIHNIDGVVGRGLLNLVRFPLIAIATLIYLTHINWSLALISLAVAPLAIVAGIVFGILLRNNSQLIHEVLSSITKSLNDTFHGFTVIRSFTLGKVFFSKYSLKNQELYDLKLKDAKLRGWFYAGGEAIGTITFFVSLLIGALFVTNSIITAGALLTFITLINHLVYPLTGLAGQWAGYQKSISALTRITNIFDQRTESTELSKHLPAYNINKSIRFQNISFSYDEQNQVFKNFNLEIPVGKVIALVGPSGGGKSTLFNLIQRFYQPQTGSIKFDNESIDTFSVSTLRNSIAYVPQDTFLFSGTIKENLLLARPGISEQELIGATTVANIHDFIMSLPMQYETEIGERGVKLSGGQRQRLSIARAILKNAPILLLDEATSALDNENECLIKEALNNVMRDRTTLIIAHRLSTIQHADLIVVMDNGMVMEKGTHGELIRKKGMYFDLYKTAYNEEHNKANVLIMNG